MGFTRTTALIDLANGPFDVVVVGGGITGAGVALDAASRGFRTALVERGDFAAGTSSKSSKLIHGGLRYLQQRDVRLVYEALAERHRLMHNAPHLVQELPFLLPMFHRDGLVPKKAARAIGAAMWGYDLTGGLRIGKRHRKLDLAETAKLVPSLKTERIAWSYLYFDAAADDARLTLTVLRTAALDFGATVANGVELVGVAHRPGSDSGPLQAAKVRTVEGDEFEIETRCIVNATGVWADKVTQLDAATPPIASTPAKGVHLTFASSHFRSEVAAIVPVAGDRRSVFLVPWGEQTYVGTTDTAFDGDLDNPTTTQDDVEYILRALNTSLNVDLTPADVLATWAGLRPLVSDASSARTADLSRRHRVLVSPSGVITVTGGKLTTYRDMAADAVDAVVDFIDPPPALRSCRTAKLRLRGAEGYDGFAPTARVDSATLDHLTSRHGGEAGTVLALIEGDPRLAEPMVDGLPYLKAEALYAARYEMATGLDDIVSRRTRARLRDARRTAAAAPATAAIVASELGWDHARVAAEVADVERRCNEDLSCVNPPMPVLP